MTLRADENDNSNLLKPGLSYFWQDVEKPPGYDWDQLIQLFEVTALVRHSISMSGLVRDTDAQSPRVAALMGNLEEVPAGRKIFSSLYISIGKTGRQVLMDKFPNINIRIIELRNIVQHCSECFQTRRNRTLDRHSLLSCKQKPNETLNQFWNNLNGLADRCDFGNQT